LANTRSLPRQAGFTVAELLVAIGIISIILVPATLAITHFYGATIVNSAQARLAVESGNLLRSVVEELRTSSGIRANNTIADANAPIGGWTTSNASLVLIISTPVTDTSNNYVIDPLTGDPYQNELVYFANNGVLYKRYLANASATGNRYKTSCPLNLSTASCPPDVVLTEHFEDMNFIFYDQDDAETTVLDNARSIKLLLDMEQQTFGQTITFSNSIRITLRNSNTL
jgi:prepilin-type N-terminal cleavage/methylation domain-containing protein